jgi:hypothetical protein
LQKEAQIAKKNWAPLSVVTISGMPKRATHVVRNAPVQEAAEISFSGVASNHLVVRSMTVKIYSQPSSETGRGPTKSTWTWENLLVGIGMGCSEARVCLVTLAC